MATTTDYSIELRDKDGLLKTYLTPFVTNVTWEWNRIGGCGRCSITLKQAYRKVEFEARDDIQIRVKSGATSKLVYRGWISNITPTLKVDQTITLDVRGYFDLLEKIVVHDAGDLKTYTNSEVSVIVDSIADTFITPKSPITLGTIDTSGFTVDSIQFLTSVKDVLDTLANLVGNAEYGVDEDLVFYWRNESEVIKNKFFVGDNVVSLERRVNWNELVNKVYLVGGEISDGVKLKRTQENTDSQTTFGLAEQIINNSSITTYQVADTYITTLLTEKSSPQIDIRAKIVNTDLRIEDTVPLGLISFFDADNDDISKGDIIGEAADGGSDITVGELADGGSDVLIGTVYSGQINRLSYSLSDTPGHFNIEVQLGDTILETSAKLKRLELSLNNMNQL
jgi:hypothetical protein